MTDTPCPFCQEKDAEIVRLNLRIDELKQIINTTPVLVIDVRQAMKNGEDEAVNYARDIVDWSKKATEAIK